MKVARRHVLIGAGTLIFLALSVVCIVVLKLSVYRIESRSMEPDFPLGTIVIESARVPLEPHRVITFTADDATVTHVLVGFNKDGSLITRGTANATNDVWHSPVYPRDVKGHTLFQVRLFAPSFWLSTRGIALIAGAGLIICAVYVMRNMFEELSYSRLQSNSK